MCEYEDTFARGKFEVVSWVAISYESRDSLTEYKKNCVCVYVCGDDDFN